jgi:hypothetical protein
VLIYPVIGRSAGETLFDSEPERVAIPVPIVTNQDRYVPSKSAKRRDQDR